MSGSQPFLSLVHPALLCSKNAVEKHTKKALLSIYSDSLTTPLHATQFSQVFPHDRWLCGLLSDPIWVSFSLTLKNFLCFILGLVSLSAHHRRYCCSHKHCSQPCSSPDRSWCHSTRAQALLPVHDWYCWKYSHFLCFQFCTQWVRTLSCHLVISTTMAWPTHKNFRTTTPD